MKDELLDLLEAVIFALICAAIIGLFVFVGYIIYPHINISSSTWQWSLFIIALFLIGVFIFKLWIRIHDEHMEEEYGFK